MPKTFVNVIASPNIKYPINKAKTYPILIIGCNTERLPNLKAIIIDTAPIPYNTNPINKVNIPFASHTFQQYCPKAVHIAEKIIIAIPILFFFSDNMNLSICVFLSIIISYIHSKLHPCQL